MNAAAVILFSGVWILVGGFTGAILHDETDCSVPTCWAAVVAGPLSWCYMLARWGVDSARTAIRERRRDAARRLERDYYDVLQMIEWKPKELTEVQRLEEEISV